MTITIEAKIGGTPFLPSAFRVHSGVYGSVGHAEIDTSIVALAAANIDVVGKSLAAPQGLEVTIAVQLDDGGKTALFGGEYVRGKWDYDDDKVELEARDWAGVLVDQKRVLTSEAEGMAAVLAPGQSLSSAGIITQNQTLTALITQIAKQFSLTPVINLGADDNPQIGSLFGDDDTVFTPVPTTLWGILNDIARTTGNEVYVTPDRKLVFGPPGVGAATLNLTYKINPVPTGSIPIRKPVFTHNPRRNASFRVLVMSYNPATAQVTEGTAYVIGTNFSGSNNQTIAPGLWEGASTSQIDAALLGQSKQIPLYTFHVDGLTGDQAQARALAIANDIARREFIVTATADVIPTVIPMQHARIDGPIDPNFSGNDFYLNAYKHEFTLRGGLITDLTLLDLPLGGIGQPITKKTRVR
jgi:hypothetical protein